MSFANSIVCLFDRGVVWHVVLSKETGRVALVAVFRTHQMLVVVSSKEVSSPLEATSTSSDDDDAT